MQNRKLIPIQTSSRDFYFDWLSLIKPFHKLTDSEMKVAAQFLSKRAELSKGIIDENILDRFLMSTEIKNEIKKAVEVTENNFQVVMTSLRSSGFIKNNKINKVFIPDYDGGETFQLTFNFKINNGMLEGTTGPEGNPGGSEETGI